MLERLLRKSADGCCGDAKWRGRLCSYHQGYEDGLDMMAALLVKPTAGELHGEDPALD